MKEIGQKIFRNNFPGTNRKPTIGQKRAGNLHEKEVVRFGFWIKTNEGLYHLLAMAKIGLRVLMSKLQNDEGYNFSDQRMSVYNT
jgi:hypothetical protein